MFFSIWGGTRWIQDGKTNASGYFLFSWLLVWWTWVENLRTFQIPQILKERCKFTLRWLRDLGNTSLEKNLRMKTSGYLLFILFILLNCCLDAPWLTFGFYWRNSVTHLMLTPLHLGYHFLIQRWLGWVGSLHLIEFWVGVDHNGITHLAIHPKLQKILSPYLHSGFSKCGNAPNTQNSYSLMLEMSTIKTTRLIAHRNNTFKVPLESFLFLVSCGFCCPQLWQPSYSVLFCLR